MMIGEMINSEDFIAGDVIQVEERWERILAVDEKENAMSITINNARFDIPIGAKVRIIPGERKFGLIRDHERVF